MCLKLLLLRPFCAFAATRLLRNIAAGTILEARENFMERIQAQFVGVELHFENLERPKKFYIELHPLARSLENSPQLNTYR